MRVCLVVVEADHWRVARPDGGPPPISGMGEVVRLNARVLSEAGHEVIAALPPTESLANALAPYCTTIVELAPSTRAATLGRNLSRLRRLLRDHRPDVVHFHVPHYRWALDMLIGMHFARKVKVVRTEHNPMMVRPRQPYRALLRIADAAVDRFVYVSEGNRHRWESWAPWRRHGAVVVNVIDAQRLDGERKSRPVADARTALPAGSRAALFIAGAWSVETSEGRRPLAPVLHAMSSVPADWHLLVAGTGDATRAGVLADRLGLRERVHFLGPVPDAAGLTAACDLLVSASHFEGLSVAFLEAWYAGVPVLCTDVDGVADVIGAAASDVVVGHGDIAAFASRWRTVGDDSTAFMRATRTAIERVRKDFLVPRFRTDMLAVYDDVAD